MAELEQTKIGLFFDSQVKLEYFYEDSQYSCNINALYCTGYQGQT